MSAYPGICEALRGTAAETRAQIVAAARSLLGGEESAARFSVDAVARAADVARMTVYHRFGSRAGLLEVIFDDLAERGEIATRLPAALAQPDVERTAAVHPAEPPPSG